MAGEVIHLFPLAQGLIIGSNKTKNKRMAQFNAHCRLLALHSKLTIRHSEVTIYHTKNQTPYSFNYICTSTIH